MGNDQTHVSDCNIGDIILNLENVYIGDLKHYFRVLLLSNRGWANGYHNIRHSLHVLWLCYDASDFYTPGTDSTVGRRFWRNLFIAAMFHDFDHSGWLGHDDLEIERAVRGFRHHVLEEDFQYCGKIESLIRATEFPHKGDSNTLPLPHQILRDADLAQGLDSAWIQQIVFGLGAEANKTPTAMFEEQLLFLNGLQFTTDWAKSRFPPRIIERKKTETKLLIRCLA